MLALIDDAPLWWARRPPNRLSPRTHHPRTQSRILITTSAEQPGFSNLFDSPAIITADLPRLMKTGTGGMKIARK